MSETLQPSKAEHVTLRDHLERLMEERDRRYTERAEEAKAAAALALTELDKRTTLAFTASETAIVKAETAQREYNIRSNEFRGQLDDQAKRLMPREESNARFQSVEDKVETRAHSLEEKIDEVKKEVATLREFKSGLGGQATQRESSHQQSNWLIALMVGVGFGAVQLIVQLLRP